MNFTLSPFSRFSAEYCSCTVHNCKLSFPSDGDDGRRQVTRRGGGCQCPDVSPVSRPRTASAERRVLRSCGTAGRYVRRKPPRTDSSCTCEPLARVVDRAKLLTETTCEIDVTRARTVKQRHRCVALLRMKDLLRQSPHVIAGARQGFIVVDYTYRVTVT